MVALSSWPKIIVSLVSLILSIIILDKYFKNKTKERLTIGTYFITLFLGWGLVALSSETQTIMPVLSIYSIITGSLFISVSALIVFLFSFTFRKYKKMWIPYLISGLVVFGHASSLLLLPINFVEGTFDFHPIQDMMSLLIVLIALYTALFFIKTSFNKQLSQKTRKKTLFYGTGLFLIDVGSFGAAISVGVLPVTIMMTLVAIGTIIVFLTEK